MVVRLVAGVAVVAWVAGVAVVAVVAGGAVVAVVAGVAVVAVVAVVDKAREGSWLKTFRHNNSSADGLEVLWRLMLWCVNFEVVVEM